MSPTQASIRGLIVRKKQENPHFSHNDIAQSMKIAKSTVTKVLKRFSERLTTERKVGSGRKKGFISKKKASEVVQAFKRNPGLSIRDVAKEVHMSPAYVQKVRREKGLRSFKVPLATNGNNKQILSAKTSLLVKMSPMPATALNLPVFTAIGSTARDRPSRTTSDQGLPTLDFVRKLKTNTKPLTNVASTTTVNFPPADNSRVRIAAEAEGVQQPQDIFLEQSSLCWADNSHTKTKSVGPSASTHGKIHCTRELIVRKKQENPNFSHSDIAKSMNIAKSTVTKVLKRFSERMTTERKVGSGRKKGFISKKKAREVVQAFQQNPGLSIRDVAKEVHMSPAYVQKVRQRRGLRSFKFLSVPNGEQ